MPRKKMHCDEYSPIWNPVSKYEDPIKAMRRSGTCSWYIFHNNRPCHPFISTFYCLNGFEEEDKTKVVPSKLIEKAAYDHKAAWDVKNMFASGRKKHLREERREALESVREEKATFTTFWITVYTLLRDVDAHIEWRDQSDAEIKRYVKGIAEREYSNAEKQLSTSLKRKVKT